MILVDAVSKLETFVWILNQISRSITWFLFTQRNHTWSNDQSQHDLLCGGVSESLHDALEIEIAAFKLPSLSLKTRRRQLSLPEFRWNSISLKEELGRGTFGTVYLAKCTGEEQCVVIKKLKGEAADAKRRFEIKEAAILYAVKGHRNISC